MQIIIVGGVAGGMSAAARLRRLDEHATIIVLERSGYVSFANCGLPYHIGGVIESRGDLLLQTPDSLGRRFGIDVRVRHEVTAINREARTVTVRNLETDQTEELPYDKLVLSPGARPVRPPLPGIERALGLRDIEDTDAIMAALAELPEGADRTAVVIGGGFIGVQVAENLIHRDVTVALVEATPQVMAPLDPEMVTPIHRRLREHGIDLHLGTSVTEITEDAVKLSNGQTLPAALVVAAIGVRPDDALAREAGLAVGERGGIVVDAQFRTDDENIFAVGDAVVKKDAVSGDDTLVPLAQTANRQGRHVADVIVGREINDAPVLGTAIVGVFGLMAASTGWNEKRLKAAGRSYRAIHTHPADHATYYPGANTMALKLLFDPQTGEILGAQGTGESGVDKRIDVIATAMRAGIKARDLADLELAYAPPFGSAKDPVNILGYIAGNMLDGLVDTIQWDEIERFQAEGGTLIDIRTPGEFDDGTIPGSLNLPLDDLRDRLDEIPQGPIVVSCAVGFRGNVGSRLLQQRGHEVLNLDGGYRTWLDGMASRG